MPETQQSLRHLIRSRLRDHRIVVVSNREPYMHVTQNGHVQCIRPASGVTVALDPVMRASRGVWVAHGSGSADRRVSDSNGYVSVPPGHPQYRLRRVWLSKRQENGYYYGFANSALWPLCHVAFRRPVFRRTDWEAYRRVNRIFADHVAEEIRDQRAFVFIQDYHFALLPRMLRERCPRAVIAHFWHIPWPNPEIFRVCPWRHEILDGMLGSDVLGFHIRYHCQNFIDTVDRELEARPDRELTAIVYGGHTTRIRAFPISIDFEDVSRQAASARTRKAAATFHRKRRLKKNTILGVGADRLDYTKGVPDRLEAIDRLLERYPQYQGRFVFVQAGVPSRTQIEEYRRVNQEVAAKVAALNEKYQMGEWQPVIFLHEHVPLAELLGIYRLARFLVVSSLHDGMNLVAKEFVASKVDRSGVLLLSRFTGAARELKDAVIVNPFAPDDLAEKMHAAIEMPQLEVRRRMTRLRTQVRDNNIYKWAAEIIRKLSKLA